MIRLQHENKMLKLQQGELGDEKVLSLSGDLELANSRINELETDHRYQASSHSNTISFATSINVVDFCAIFCYCHVVVIKRRCLG